MGAQNHYPDKGGNKKAAVCVAPRDAEEVQGCGVHGKSREVAIFIWQKLAAQEHHDIEERTAGTIEMSL
jgi:hypothetical protein